MKIISMAAAAVAFSLSTAQASTVMLETHGTGSWIDGFLLSSDNVSSFSGVSDRPFNDRGQLTEDGFRVRSRPTEGNIADSRYSNARNIPSEYGPLGRLSVSSEELLSETGIVGSARFSYDSFDRMNPPEGGEPVGISRASASFTYVLRADVDSIFDVTVRRIADGGTLSGRDFFSVADNFESFSFELAAGEGRALRLGSTFTADSFFSDGSGQLDFTVSLREGSFSVVPRVVPLPASALLLLTGLAGIALHSRRQRNKAVPS